jgi:hypothetical protein
MNSPPVQNKPALEAPIQVPSVATSTPASLAEAHKELLIKPEPVPVPVSTTTTTITTTPTTPTTTTATPINLPTWAIVAILVVVLLIVAVGMYIQFQRYMLIAQAISSGQSGTALALAAPEIGQGFGAATSSLFSTGANRSFN